MYIEKEITVGELKDLFHNGQYQIEIDTPDGYQEITQWFDKGLLPMIKIQTETKLETRCAVNHLLQSENIWKLPTEMNVGDSVKTINSEHDKISSIENLDSEECYDFTVNHPNHRYWGDGFSSHNSAKSFISSGNVVKNAQEQGVFVLLIDTENALDEPWLQALGVDTSEDKLLKLNIGMIDELAGTLTEFLQGYKATPVEDRVPVLIVIDSFGMLLTPTDKSHFESSEVSKGDFGIKAKSLLALVKNLVMNIVGLDLGILATQHSYQSQDMYDPDQIISGGGWVYAASIVVAMKKLKLKEDEEGNKTKVVNGIRAGVKVMKTRYNKPFQTAEIKIPYDHGMNPMSGLFDLFESKGLFEKEGNSYIYKFLDGSTVKMFKKRYEKNDKDVLTRMMDDYMEVRRLNLKVDKSIIEVDDAENMDSE